MDYKKRNLEEKFLRMSSFFKAVLVTGARQVGKTTMLTHLAKKQRRTYVSLDNLAVRNLAQTDPVLFFQRYKPPMIIDEVQYAPQLFSQIKIVCDNSDETGLFWLTGSQQYSMMKNVRESLAGRLGIMQLHSFSYNEKKSIVFNSTLDFSLKNLLERQQKTKKNDITKIFRHVWEGGMPETFLADDEQRKAYYDSYIDTYLMRDAAELGGVTDSLRFRKFMEACAAITSQQLNYRTLAEAADISQPTAKVWTELLEGMGIIYLLRPYFNNELKRLTKRPKIYFYDTGLCAHLSMWLTPETLMVGAASGRYFENHVVIELVKAQSYSYSNVNMTYYRDSNAKEIDVLIEGDGMVHPFEIKKSANPDRREIKKFKVFDKVHLIRGHGGIICMCEDVIPIDEANCMIPCNLL